MNIISLSPLALIAAAAGFIYLRRAKIKAVKYSPREVSHTASIDVFTEKTPEEIRQELTGKLDKAGMKIHSQDYTRIVFEKKKSGLFSWGFLYIADFEERPGGTLVTLGIFGRGPNPPRKKTQAGILNDFVNKEVMPL